MIRFVYIGSQIVDNSTDFAWFNTVTDQFIEFNGTHVWADWDEFEGDYTDKGVELSRFKRLYQDSPPDTLQTAQQYQNSPSDTSPITSDASGTRSFMAAISTPSDTDTSPKKFMSYRQRWEISFRSKGDTKIHHFSITVPQQNLLNENTVFRLAKEELSQFDREVIILEMKPAGKVATIERHRWDVWPDVEWPELDELEKQPPVHSDDWKLLLLSTIKEEWPCVDTWAIHVDFFSGIQEKVDKNKLKQMKSELKQIEAIVLEKELVEAERRVKSIKVHLFNFSQPHYLEKELIEAERRVERLKAKLGGEAK